MLPIVPGSKKLLIVAMVGLLAACGGSEERKAKYMDEGKQLFTAGDYQKAQLSFKNVLQIDPKDVEDMPCPVMPNLGQTEAAELTRKMADLEKLPLVERTARIDELAASYFGTNTRSDWSG